MEETQCSLYCGITTLSLEFKSQHTHKYSKPFLHSIVSAPIQFTEHSKVMTSTRPCLCASIRVRETIPLPCAGQRLVVALPCSSAGSASIRSRLVNTCSRTARNGKTSRRPSGQPSKMLPGPTRGRDRTTIAELFADERCSQAILDFLATTVVGRTADPPVAEEGEGAASDASEWEDQGTRGAARNVEGGGGGGETGRGGAGG